MTTPATITRKEISDLLSVSVDTVRRMDDRVRLREARVFVGGRLVLYSRPKVLLILRRIGFEI